MTIVTLAAIATALVQTSPPQLRIDPEPVIEIGASATDPNDQLFGVGRVLRSSDGGILIVEGTAGRIRRYSPDGGFVRDLGRSGDGPGEFRQILDAALNADTLLVLDQDGSVTGLRLDGSVIYTGRTDVTGLTDERFNPVPHGILADGRVLIRASERVFGRPDGDHIQSIGWMTVDRAGRVDTLAFLDSHRMRSDDGVPRPYRPWLDADFAGKGDDVWLSVPIDGRLYRPNGGLEIRPPARSGRPSSADLVRFRDQYVGRGVSDNDRRVISEWVDGAPVAQNLPLLRRFTLDQLGRIWIERWQTEGSQTGWDVYSSDGDLVASATIPMELRLETAGEDWIVGVWLDGLGVERVGAFQMAR